jgi:hypothetical protein
VPILAKAGRSGLEVRRVARTLWSWCREGELNPQGTKYRRILSSQAGSDPL